MIGPTGFFAVRVAGGGGLPIFLEGGVIASDDVSGRSVFFNFFHPRSDRFLLFMCQAGHFILISCTLVNPS